MFWRQANWAALCVFATLFAGCTGPCPPTPLSDEPLETGAAATTSSAPISKDLLDPRLPDYHPLDRLDGRITTVGSDTMNNIVALWVEGFRRHYPNVEFEVESKGSSTAVPALVAGAAMFGPMSRDMKQGEIDDFQAKFGYKPTPLATAMDMLAVYVNKDNPIASLTLAQVDAIFSKTRRLGYPQDISTWGQLGLSDDWQQQTISLYGRNAASGTYGYFKDHALRGGDFKDAVKEQPGSSSVVQAVGSEPAAIGYSGIGYRTADVRLVPLAREQGDPPVEPLPQNAYSGEYPLSRYLWLVVNYPPRGKLDPLPREFVKYVLSRQGQEKVIEDGYLPLTAELARDMLTRVGIE
jgi:phosphate transport system substrate-binding protein